MDRFKRTPPLSSQPADDMDPFVGDIIPSASSSFAASLYREQGKDETDPLKEYGVRLMTFFESEGKWVLATPSPEDMAGAGFRLQGLTSNNDTVVCDFCSMQSWKWESKDDPFTEHESNYPHCLYVTSKTFAQLREAFLKKREVGGGGVVLAAAAVTATPPSARKPRKGKSVVSKIRTVADIEPQAALVAKAEPMHITIAGPGVRMVLQVNGQGQESSEDHQRVQKRLRLE